MNANSDKVMPCLKIRWSHAIPLVAMLILSSCTTLLQKQTVSPLTVAFTGDTGYDEADTPEIDTGFEEVMELVKSEDADLLVILGDFTYEEDIDKADVYFRNINRVLGEDFPILGTDGNHDTWSHYEQYFQERMERMGLDGDLIDEDTFAVTYGGIDWILLGNHPFPGFLQKELRASENPWKVCGWHRVMNDMNAGGKGDEMGWEVYQACQNAGAIIATAHEHSYSRTMTLTDLGNSAGGHGATGDPNIMEVAPGRTFVFVSGMGGRPARDYHCDVHEDDTWWSTIYTSNYYLNNGEEVVKDCSEDAEVVENYSPGVLFVTFNAGGDPTRADAYFKNVHGEVIDEFTIIRGGGEVMAGGSR